MDNVRTYVLRLYGSRSKFQDLEWSSYQYIKLTNAFIEHLYFNDHVDFYSTKGLGLLGNQAQRKARGIVSAKKTLEKDQGHKKSCPNVKTKLCFANIEKQSNAHEFNYKIGFSLGFDGKGKTRFLFAKGTSPLKRALKKHYWKLSNQAEIFQAKNGQWFVRVFVSRPRVKPKAHAQSIGVDVGVNHIVATSENFLGNSLSKRLKRISQSRKERQRQLALAKNRGEKELVEKLKKKGRKQKITNKAILGQLLDKEAKRLIARGLATSSNLVVEDPKVLANLKSRGLLLWARTYLAYRLQTLGQENGLFVVFTHPSYTSISCHKCGAQDKLSRVKERFHCTVCGHQDQADVNAAKNLALKGQEFVDVFVRKVKAKPQKTSTVRAPSDSF